MSTILKNTAIASLALLAFSQTHTPHVASVSGRATRATSHLLSPASFADSQHTESESRAQQETQDALIKAFRRLQDENEQLKKDEHRALEELSRYMKTSESRIKTREEAFEKGIKKLREKNAKLLENLKKVEAKSHDQLRLETEKLKRALKNEKLIRRLEKENGQLKKDKHRALEDRGQYFQLYDITSEQLKPLRLKNDKLEEGIRQMKLNVTTFEREKLELTNKIAELMDKNLMNTSLLSSSQQAQQETQDQLRRVTADRDSEKQMREDLELDVGVKDNEIELLRETLNGDQERIMNELQQARERISVLERNLETRTQTNRELRRQLISVVRDVDPSNPIFSSPGAGAAPAAAPRLRGQANERQAALEREQRQARQAREAEAGAKWQEETGELVSKAEAKGIEIPDHFLCPITREIMRDPVLATDERTYERSAIERYLETKNTSPMTREVFASKHVTANRGLREAIAEYLENLKVEVEGESA